MDELKESEIQLQTIKEESSVISLRDDVDYFDEIDNKIDNITNMINKDLQRDYHIQVYPTSNEKEVSSEESDSDNEEKETTISSGREVWIAVTNLLTFFVPDCLLQRALSKNKDTIQAWREKVVFFMFFLFVSSLFIFVVAIIPKLLCIIPNVFTWKDINESKKQLMVLRGSVIDVTEYKSFHPGSIDTFLRYSGQDVSYMFETLDILTNKPNNLKIYTSLLNLFEEFKSNDTSRYCLKYYCHPYPMFLYESNSTLMSPKGESFEPKHLKNYVLGDILLTYSDLRGNRDQNWFVLYDKVYNVTEYVKYGHSFYPAKYDDTPSKEVAYYLDERLNSTILNRLGQDATNLFESNFRDIDRQSIVNYLDSMYFMGKLDTRYNPICASFDIVYLVILGCISTILLTKFLLALCVLNKNYSKSKGRYVVTFIPCYTEDKTSIEKTIHSIVDSKYDDEKKLLFIVVDGLLKGKGNDEVTAEIVLNIFGRKLENTSSFKYKCINEENKAQVYSGFYSNIPYIVVVKTGLENEEKKGNRGKRDSQLILLNFLKRIYYNDELSKLDEVILSHFNDLKLRVESYEFLLSVDADTQVKYNAIKQMIYRMIDSNIFALCGETRVYNKFDSLVSSIQVYEYYFSHNLNKAFESLFGSVTCLPGCFTMFRIKTDCKRQKPVIILDKLLEEYSDNDVNTLHKKNLLLLGEDRYFTTLLIKYFPTAKFKYTTTAKCYTTVPDTLSVLLSQRRRWINSTVHNLFRLLFVRRLCGVCCFSLKFMILVDLITTLLLPVACFYFIYLIYAFSFGLEPVNVVFITMTTVILGIQVLIFVIKRDFIYIFWFILYLLSLPLFMIVIPVYSFMKMDDFRWGTTQK